MENVNIHKQKLITIIMAALVLILLFLPWQKIPALVKSNYMGYTIWGGIICAIAAAAAAGNCLMGNQRQPFTKQTKIIAIVCFAVIFLFALIVAIASSGTEQVDGGGYYVEVKKSAGIGAWLTMVVGLAGIAWTSGILGQLMQQKPAGSMPPPPPPPPTA